MPEIGLLSPGEILMLILVHRYRGPDAMKRRRLALDLKPEVENEQRLLEVGFLADGKNAMGKPARGTIAITEEGVAAIKKNLRPCIAKLKADNGNETMAERKDQRDRVRKRLEALLVEYPDAAAPAAAGGKRGVSRAEDPDAEEEERIVEPGQAEGGGGGGEGGDSDLEEGEGDGDSPAPPPERRGLAPSKGVMQGAADKGIIARKLKKPVLGGGKKAPPARNPRRK